MARDPDQPSVAFIKETRGRRSKSLRIRDSARLMEGLADTLRTVPKVLQVFGEAAFFVYSVYAARVKFTVTYGTNDTTAVTVVDNVDPLKVYYVVPTFRKKPVLSMLVRHPDLPTLEGIGMVLLLTNLPSGGVLEIIEDAAVLILYHSLLNGFKFTFPGQLAPGSATWVSDMVLDFGMFFGVLPKESTTIPASLNLPGLFPQGDINQTGIALAVRDAYRNGEFTPDPSTAYDPARPTMYAIDGLITRSITLPRVLASLAHAGFLDAFLRKGLPTIGTGP